jgi:hypothetical protein
MLKIFIHHAKGIYLKSDDSFKELCIIIPRFVENQAKVRVQYKVPHMILNN